MSVAELAVVAGFWCSKRSSPPFPRLLQKQQGNSSMGAAGGRVELQLMPLSPEDAHASMMQFGGPASKPASNGGSWGAGDGSVSDPICAAMAHLAVFHCFPLECVCVCGCMAALFSRYQRRQIVARGGQHMLVPPCLPSWRPVAFFFRPRSFPNPHCACCVCCLRPICCSSHNIPDPLPHPLPVYPLGNTLNSASCTFNPKKTPDSPTSASRRRTTRRSLWASSSCCMRL